MRNVAECTKLNGYFIGTCYDGKRVFDLLKSKENGESMTILKNGQKIFEITKLYDETGFPDDEMSVGYPINVYQESINRVFREYLVNFDYLVRILENYGFVLLGKNDEHTLNGMSGTGMFDELYRTMKRDIRDRPNTKSDYKSAMYMSPEEEKISFLNRYFIFQKKRSVDTKMLYTRQMQFQSNRAEKQALVNESDDHTVRILGKVNGRKIVLKSFIPIPMVDEDDRVERIEPQQQQPPIVPEKIRIKVKRPKNIT